MNDPNIRPQSRRNCRKALRVSVCSEGFCVSSSMTKTTVSLFMVMGLSLILAAPTWADFQAGLEAADRGDYRTAVKEFQLSAERGDVKARYSLGVMYQLGLGVPQDDQETVRWYQLAAEQGDASAQHNLGMMYFEGKGVPKNDVQAYLWMSLAAGQGTELARKNLAVIEEEMTLDQITEAQRLAREWKAKGK